VISVAYSPDGSHIVSGSYDKTVRIWDASTGAQVKQLDGHTSLVISVAYSPDGSHIVSGSYDNTVRIWDASTGAQVRQLDGHTEAVTSVAYSPDGSHIVSGSYDKTVRIWDTSTGAQVKQLDGHTEAVTSVAYSPDGSHIVSGSYDKTVQGVKVATMATETSVILASIHGIHYPKWNISIDGWMLMDNETQLYWLPKNLCHVLQHPCNSAIISSSWFVSLKICNAHVGEQWSLCYLH
jgi:WD40 repeat protein